MKGKFALNLSRNTPKREQQQQQQQHRPQKIVPPTVSAPPVFRNVPSPYAVPVELYTRRTLPADTERELREACAVILANFKPSSQIYEEQNLQAAINSFARPGTASGRPDAAAHAQLGFERVQPAHRLELEALDPRKFSYKPQTALHDLFSETDSARNARRANIGRRRDSLSKSERPYLDTPAPGGSETATKHHEPSSFKKHFTLSNRPTHSHRKDSYDTNTSTPHTYSSDQPRSTSTGITSAGFTPSDRSKHPSKHTDHDPQSSAQREAAARYWAKVELGRRGSKDTDGGREARPPSRNSRPSSRAGSVRSLGSSIRDYIRPGTSHGRESRSSSRASFRSTDSIDSDNGAPARPGTAQSWRSWGFGRRGSKSSLHSSTGSSSGKREKSRKGDGNEVNLNRALPPLPALDTYEETKPKAHIANLMRGIRSQSPMHDSPPILDRNRTAFPAKEIPIKGREPPPVAPTAIHPAHRKMASAQNVPAPAAMLPSRPHTSAAAAQSKRSLPGPDHGESITAPLEGPGALHNPSSPRAVLRNAPSAPFMRHSRHMSIETWGSGTNQSDTTERYDTHGSASTPEREFRRAMQLPLDPLGGNKRVMATIDAPLSIGAHGSGNKERKRWWKNSSSPSSKKNKKQTSWMDQIEKMGVRGGVIEDFGHQQAPVVRY